jgi:predicted peroxiredoxin
MSENSSDLVIMITHGMDHELSSVGFTIANGGITEGLNVSVFLSSSGVDLVRKGAADAVQVHQLELLSDLIRSFQKRGGNLSTCTPCVNGRGYNEENLIEGTVVTDASLMHSLIRSGAATLTF